MNPLLILMIFAVAVALWFALRKIFRPLGGGYLASCKTQRQL